MPFWSKDDKDRLDQTIAYIAGLCPVGERTTITNFWNHWIQANMDANAQKLFSASISTKGHTGVGDEKTRAARRALAMLAGNGMLNPANARCLTVAQVMALDPGMVAQKIMQLIEPFRIYALQQEKVNTLLQIELNKLRVTPETFLQNNLVVCQSYGAPPGGEREHTFFFNYKDQAFTMWPTAPGWNPPPWLNGAGIKVAAINVPEVYWANVPGRGATATGPTAGNFSQIVSTPFAGTTGTADFMVTSAFSGCSFCFKSGAGGVFAAHVSPATPNDPSIGGPPTLATQLIANGNFHDPVAARAGGLQVWGRGLSNLVGHAGGYAVDPIPGQPLINASMYVIGTRNNGGWSIHSQENRGGTKTVTRLL